MGRRNTTIPEPGNDRQEAAYYRRQASRAYAEARRAERERINWRAMARRWLSMAATEHRSGHHDREVEYIGTARTFAALARAADDRAPKRRDWARKCADWARKADARHHAAEVEHAVWRATEAGQQWAADFEARYGFAPSPPIAI